MHTDVIARRFAAGALFTGLLFAPALAFGQQASTEGAAANAVRAEALSREAQGLYGNPKRWREAAELHVRSAGLRPAGDLRGVEELVIAARLLYHRGALTAARSTMVDAADRALSIGELIRAANRYLDAALIARRQGLGAQAYQLTTRAELLANSTLLDEQDRSAILRRVARGDSPITDPLS